MGHVSFVFSPCSGKFNTWKYLQHFSNVVYVCDPINYLSASKDIRMTGGIFKNFDISSAQCHTSALESFLFIRNLPFINLNDLWMCLFPR